MRFLDFFGMIPRDLAAQHPADSGMPKRYEVTDVLVAKTDRFRFAQPFLGFEDVTADALIATDGDAEIRAPAGGCTIIMPARQRSEEHTSELQSLMRISYAVFCLKKKKTPQICTHS